MRKALVILLGVCFLAMFIGSVSARDVKNVDKRVYRDWTEEEFPATVDKGANLFTSAAVDTFCMVWYDFESPSWQGWTREDNTAQVDTFSHVDNFSGISPGYRGGLLPLEGSQSLWCGARASTDPYMCSWYRAPGYGNSWNQMLMTDPFSFTGEILFTYHGFFSSEPDYDFTHVEYDAGEGNWQELAVYDGFAVDTVATHSILLSLAQTKLRFHFTADGAWSDQDGLVNTDGAFVVDSLVIVDQFITVNSEMFETANVNDKRAGIWYGTVEEPYGRFSGLKNKLDDKDPCNENFKTQIVFFIGSPHPSGSYPGLFDTPFCYGPGGHEAPCQNETIISPILDMTKFSSLCNSVQDADIPPAALATLGGAVLRFTVYRDLPLPNLVFYTWGVRNIDVADCPGQWLDRNYVYYGPEMDYLFTTQDVSDLVTEDRLQIGIGVLDYCDALYLSDGNCAEHTPTPWMDNVRFYRYAALGPQWSWRDLDIFQDNFPSEEFEMESVIRADAANDRRPNDDPVSDPGDSAVVSCTAPLAGTLAEDNGDAAIYCHVLVKYIGDPASPKTPDSGIDLEGDWGTYRSMDGLWTVIQCDSAQQDEAIVDDKYCVDLNDSLFTRGFRIDYYFKARDADGVWTTLPGRAETHNIYFEWTCLPTLASDILYVDDFHGRGTLEGNVQTYMDPAFYAVLTPESYPDRYDVNNPSSVVGNGLGSRARTMHLTTAYRKIIWDSGNLEDATICTGDAETSGKSPDCQALVNWMDLSENEDGVGLWIMGDDIAWDLDNSPTTCALDLMSAWCGVTLVHDSYYDLTGGRVAGGYITPLLHSVPGAVYTNPLHEDSLYVDSGCAVINAFDVLGETENSQYAYEYPPFGGEQYYAAVQNERTNSAENAVKTMWFGFSFMYIRDASYASGVPIVRNRIMEAMILWMGNDAEGSIVHDDTPAAYKLAQNFPNPFNPSTTIMFDMRAKGNVSLKIYNVAGQLVRTLVNGVKDAGPHKLTWDGRNNSGVAVSSGVYFYKMETKDFSQTKKMIMLR